MTQYNTCDEFADSLADFLERDLSEPARAGMEAHALTCAECGSLLADLRRLRIDAANLPVLVPSRDLWSGIAARIDAPVIPLNAGHGAAVVYASRVVGGGDRFRRGSWMVAAAAALIAVTSGITYFATMRSVDQRVSRTAAVGAAAPVVASVARDPAAAVAGTPSASSDASVRIADPRTQPQAPRLASGTPAVLASAASKNKLSAEVTFDREIARLRTILLQRRAQIDPVTISIIERNLKVIDDAIAQCRAALAKDPASRFLMESLNNALETKVELMRTAAMLPSRT